MTPTPNSEAVAPPVFDADAGDTYTLEILARLSGVSSETILRYHERGLLRPAATGAPETGFDDDSLRRLRRLESVRETGDMNLAGLCLVARLLDEIDHLREELRCRY